MKNYQNVAAGSPRLCSDNNIHVIPSSVQIDVLHFMYVHIKISFNPKIYHN